MEKAILETVKAELESLGPERVISAITVSRGARKGQLLKSLPKNASGLLRYIWQVTSCHAGRPGVPSVAFKELRKWLEKQLGRKVSPAEIVKSGVLEEIYGYCWCLLDNFNFPAEKSSSVREGMKGGYRGNHGKSGLWRGRRLPVKQEAPSVRGGSSHSQKLYRAIPA